MKCEKIKQFLNTWYNSTTNKKKRLFKSYNFNIEKLIKTIICVFRKKELCINYNNFKKVMNEILVV